MCNVYIIYIHIYVLYIYIERERGQALLKIKHRIPSSVQLSTWGRLED